MDKLEFGYENAKLRNTVTFSLPAGHACPFAKLCKSSADRKTGKITDGAHCQFRCFGATCEARSRGLREKSWRNLDLLRTVGLKDEWAMAELIDASLLPEWRGLVRVHSTGGDFLTREYFRAWCLVAEARGGEVVETKWGPVVHGTVFYAYTKAVKYAKLGVHPGNLRLTLSWGGTQDKLIGAADHSLRVVGSMEEAVERGLDIDHDDTLAWSQEKPFAILIHGTQPKGSEAMQNLQALRVAGIDSGYGRKKKVVA